MSASREKKIRQEQAGMPDPKTAREAQQRKAEKRSNMLYGLVAAAFVLVAVAAIGWRVSIWYGERAQQTAIAASINDTEYTAAEVNFYFKNSLQNFVSQNYYYLSYLNLDVNSDLREQKYTEDETWFDFFLESALEQMADIQALNEAAAAEGYTWNDELQAQLDETVDTVKTSAGSYGYTTEQYLQALFGSNMTEKVFTEQTKRTILAQGYVSQYADSLTYSDSELSAAYAADPDSYDKVAYETIRVDGNPDTKDADGNEIEVTDEMKAQAKADAKQAADTMYAAWQNGSSLSALADENDKATYTSSEGASRSSTVLMDWLFDSKRQAGDSAVLSDDDNAAYYVAVFNDRFREDYNTVNVRHILIQPAEGELKEGDEGYEAEQEQLKAEAKQKAEDLLAQWKAGEATEDSFAALATENSSDGGSSSNGGLYTQVGQGEMVETFNDWCFDASRKSGDTGIVETTYGYHVMYFVGTDEPKWKIQVREDLADEDLNTWYAEKTEGYTAEQNEKGIQYVG